MNRARVGTLALVSLLPLLSSLGCDALTVRSFSGTVIQFTLSGASVTPPGQHLELWARTQYNDIVRINAYTDLFKGDTAFGFMIREAINPNDPCMIDAQGNLLTSAAAYPTSVTVGGVTQTPEQQALAVKNRIAQLATNPTAAPAGPLLAVLPFDPNLPPSVPDSAPPQQRLDACNAYKAAGEAFCKQCGYVPNPLQITAPLHGYVFGFPAFFAVVPPTNYDGFRVDTPVNLKGVQEIFFTLEGDNVDPKNRGPLFLTSQRVPGGNDIIQFDLIHADPNGTATGAAALYVDLDQDPVQF